MIECFKVSLFVTLCVATLELLYLYNKLDNKKVPNDSNSFKNEFNKKLHKWYLVDSPQCKIPDLNPFDVSVSAFVKREQRFECSAQVGLPLTEVVYNVKTMSQQLQFKKDAIAFYSIENYLWCCVSVISDNGYHRVSESCEYFNGSWVLNETSHFVAVYCYDIGGINGRQLIYKNLHAAVVKIKRPKTEIAKKMNVILLGFDSMSRLNLYRTMPQTVAHLHDHAWVEMRGYNKIGDNTLPNLMAVLTGLPPEHFQTAHHGFLDHYPYIWKNFSSAGYTTAYAEDQPLLDTFNCNLLGFKNPPTDYYPRAFFETAEFSFKEEIEGRECLGLKSSSEHLFDYLIDFVNVYKDDPFFGLFWVNSFCHNDLNLPSSEDGRVVSLLEQLKISGALNTTMVIFFSDHGLRVEEIRKTRFGWYEDRLPFMFIWLPEWYKSKYDTHYMNLTQNADRLTSPYDIYLTMSHVLHGEHPNLSIGCKTCHSLFEPIPVNRSCSEAGVTNHWCACHDATDLPLNDPAARYWASLVVRTINSKLEADREISLDFRCAQLELEQVLYFRKKVKPDVEEFVIAFQTSPGDAQFEATVTGNSTVDEAISRINYYGSSSHCVRNPTSKSFCYCEKKWNK